MNKYRTLLIAGGVLLLVIIGVIFFFGIKRSDPRFEGTITLWGLESSKAWGDIIRAFEVEYPKLKVEYVQKNEATYETDLVNALAAADRGPDMFVIHHTWLSKHGDKMAGAPAELINSPHFQSLFVDAAATDLVARVGVVAGVPLYMDSLALYYNKDIFNDHGVVAPPRTWEEFNTVVKQTTVLGSDGAVLQAGTALGTQNNIPHADDILEMFMLQNGSQIASRADEEATFSTERAVDGGISAGENALVYYTNFADPARDVYTWSRRMGDAQTMFKDGKVAMYIGYASELPAIRESGVLFDVAPLPQIRDRSVEPSYVSSTLAKYWGAAVSAASPKKDASWVFLLFATSRNGQFNFLSKTGLPAARRDLISVQEEQDTQLGVFARQALIAKTWPQPDYLVVTDIFKEMIENVVLGRLSAHEAILEGDDKVTELFR